LLHSGKTLSPRNYSRARREKFDRLASAPLPRSTIDSNLCATLIKARGNFTVTEATRGRIIISSNSEREVTQRMRKALLDTIKVLLDKIEELNQQFSGKR
jgi:hypothetical protein